jgi:phytoene dehydrogenase-like protein
VRILTEDTFEFIIIGGGICGLQIGALCSTIGKTLVLEAGHQIGGRAVVKEINGFRLDFGPHPVRFGQKSALAQTVRDIGGHIDFLNPGVMFAYLANGERHYFPSGNIKGILKTKMIPRGEMVRFFAQILRLKPADFDHLKQTSIEQYCIENNVGPALKRYLALASASMQVNPFLNRSSIGELFANARQVLKKKSVFYPKGGWQPIFDQLIAAINRNGEVRCNSKVTKILVENGVAIGVQVGATVINAKTIVSSVPIQQLFYILDEKFCPAPFVQRCKSLRPTMGVVIDFCLNRPVMKEALAFFEEPPGFALCPTNLDPSLAPPGKSILSAFAPTEDSIMKDPSKRQGFYKNFKEKLIRFFPDIPKSLENERPLFLEMVDGVEIAIDQYHGNLPTIDGTGIENFYLTGDSVGGEGAGGDVGHTSVRECFARIRADRKE